MRSSCRWKSRNIIFHDYNILLKISFSDLYLQIHTQTTYTNHTDIRVWLKQGLFIIEPSGVARYQRILLKQNFKFPHLGTPLAKKEPLNKKTLAINLLHHPENHIHHTLFPVLYTRLNLKLNLICFFSSDFFFSTVGAALSHYNFPINFVFRSFLHTFNHSVLSFNFHLYFFGKKIMCAVLNIQKISLLFTLKNPRSLKTINTVILIRDLHFDS